MSYKVKLEIFEGPLDLLLYLIKKNKINIYDIPIAEITEQYLSYLELMRLLDLNIAGDFLVMASTLMQIKAKMLLPQTQEKEEEEEDPRAELVRRLLEYKRFKEAANFFRKLEEERQKSLRRPSSPEAEEKEVYFEASLFDLIRAFTKALKDVPKEIFLEVIQDEFSVEDKIHEILHLLVKKEMVFLEELFEKAKNKLEIVAIFLAILELIRLKEIKARQKQLFGSIQIIRNKENIFAYER